MLTHDSKLARRRVPGARLIPKSIGGLLSCGRGAVADAVLFLTNTSDALSKASRSLLVSVASPAALWPWLIEGEVGAPVDKALAATVEYSRTAECCQDLCPEMVLAFCLQCARFHPGAPCLDPNPRSEGLRCLSAVRCCLLQLRHSREVSAPAACCCLPAVAFLFVGSGFPGMPATASQRRIIAIPPPIDLRA